MHTLTLIKLLFAHFITDFALQPKKLLEAKKGKGLQRHLALFIHSLLHAATVYIVLGEWTNWIVPTIILLSHWSIDWFKVCRPQETIHMFLSDQAAHITVIGFIWLLLFSGNATLKDWLEQNWNNRSFWIIVTAYIFVLHPTSILLGQFIKRWIPHSPEQEEQQSPEIKKDIEEKSLPQAGKWIGYFERILILTFILTHHYEGIGFLLAAKSIFRFGELSKPSEIKNTEYVLVGTLASFTIACLVGVIAEKLL
ncbi:MAG: DUF3307 domain-containing protein [Bacteroides pyogenes]|uniref:DUF3307 domain-containing protein n=1 Tax=Bacteroides pyogenes TaxID=310300 RepID=UPI002430DB3B|nr:DUF3307 domain-containing protein [Bacteroides pyogenes]MCI7070314.1 DUF3307 domain-containing protein [Bacteroides pyogenes]MDY5353187.1 DUF3307 domain-containing protein [Bacteroides pyogenes]